MVQQRENGLVMMMMMKNVVAVAGLLMVMAIQLVGLQCQCQCQLMNRNYLLSLSWLDCVAASAVHVLVQFSGQMFEDPMIHDCQRLVGVYMCVGCLLEVEKCEKSLQQRKPKRNLATWVMLVMVTKKSLPIETVASVE
jgi:hypothetical protein